MTSVGINIADIVIIAAVSFSALISLFRGFVREALSLISWFLAFWLAVNFCHPVSDLLAKYIHSPTLRLGAGFGGIFLAVLFACGMINFMISTLVDKTGLSGTDRLLGVVFGVIRGILLVAALLLVARITTPMEEENWWKSSLLIQYFEPVEAWLFTFIPQDMADHFKLTNNN